KWLPGYLREHLIQQRLRLSRDQDTIFQQVFANPLWIDPRLPSVKAPTLILWGDDDRVLDISSIGPFQAGLPNAKVAIIPACGHVPMLEKPRESARLY